MSSTQIYRKKSVLTQQALDYVKSTLYAENPDACSSYLRCMITASSREDQPELYEEDLKIFKHLFNSGNADHRLALWNNLACYYTVSEKFYRKDFTPEEYAFIKAAIKTQGNTIYEANVNAPIVTDRIVLRPIEKSDFSKFVYHYKNDGNFFEFTGFVPTIQEIKRYAERRTPTLFAIEERGTHSLIGYVGLSIKERSRTGLLEYYIFKEYRNKGYCKEAVKALIDKALINKLVEPVETIQEGVYKKKRIRLNAIRAIVVSTNIASRKTVERCGLTYEATINKSYPSSNGWVDEIIYYLPKDID